MSVKDLDGNPFSNQLLAALPRLELKRLTTQLEPISLEFGQPLYQPDDLIRHVYFPQNSLVSLLTVVDRHLALEVGMVGREGMVGIAYALNMTRSPFRAMVQGAGQAWRMKAPVFRKAMQSSALLLREVHRYAHGLMAQIAQTAACNRFHVIEARLAKWLLMTRERVRSDEFHLTHEFLGNMLGVRRVGVTNAAQALKKNGLIQYNRGDITILDRKALEAAACSCFERVKTLRGD